MTGRPTIGIGIAAAVAMSAAATIATAHSGASGVVKERMEVMKDIGDHM